SICAIVRDDADDLIKTIGAKDRLPISKADAYVTRRTQKGHILLTSDVVTPLSEAVETIYATFKAAGMCHVLISGNFRIAENDQLLVKLLSSGHKSVPALRALVDNAKKEGGYLIFGSRTSELLNMALVMEKKMSGIRQNILNGALGNLPGDRGRSLPISAIKPFPAGEERPDFILGIPSIGHSQAELDKAIATIQRLAGSRIAVEVLDKEESPEGNVNKLVGMANERGIPLVRILDSDKLDDDSITVVINELMGQAELDREELVRIMEFLKKTLDKIDKVDIDKVLAAWQARTLRRDPSFLYKYHPATNKMFKEATNMVSAATQGVVDSGLSWAARIQERWDRMGVKSKNDDPVKETIVITDSGINTTNIDKYLASRGLDKYIDSSNAVFANTKDTKALSYVEDEISRITGVSKDHIGIRSKEGELSVTGDPESVLLQLKHYEKTGQFVNINMYEVLFDLLSNNGEWRPIPGLDKKGKNLFIYLPPMVPRDYQAEMENYSRTVEKIMKSA
ncbi:MAG: hypothetical protein Q8N91_04275, partial [Candidatus Omnitrophota bacterium]|nr:hypothetical protein [Candidatus Omnitrophota bacterium]